MIDEDVSRFFKKLNRYSQQFSRLEELLSNLVSDSSELLHQLAECDCQTGKLQASARAPRQRRKFPQAAPQAMLLKITAHADGSAEVCLDNGMPIRLTTMLADLLAVLADKQIGWSADDLVGWKSYETVRSALKQKTGRAISRKALHQNVFRLRAAFEKHGWSPHLIQTHPRHGIRFALKKNLPPEFQARAAGPWTKVIEGD